MTPTNTDKIIAKTGRRPTNAIGNIANVTTIASMLVSGVDIVTLPSKPLSSPLNLKSKKPTGTVLKREEFRQNTALELKKELFPVMLTKMLK